ncbi:acyltransferase family protein [Dictyobacter formicarum]|uniref:acyltransferase family protein n=1 Tax=Dictyobacter formicarum TaxID=2778368 RepID=UPI001914E4B0|nr:acyltransferase [Dictyobacter formicarum]
MWRRDTSLPEVTNSLVSSIQMWSQSVTCSLEDSKQKKTIYALDGIRALTCLGVVSFHLNLRAYIAHVWSPFLDNFGAMISSLALIGETGVLLFFLLSGFLLFLPYAKAMLFDSDWPSWQRFYIRRIFRIFPGYYVALFLMLLYLSPEYLRAANWDKLFLFLTFRMDFPATYQQLNAPFWTLAIEVQFYLVLPLIAWLIGRLVRGGSLRLRMCKLSFCLALLWMWGFITRYWGFKLADTHQLDTIIPHEFAQMLRPYIFGTVGKFFESFAIGMSVCMLYIYLHSAPNAANLKGRISRFCPLILGAGLVLLFAVNIWHYYVIYMIHLSFHFLDPYQNFMESYRDIVMQDGFSFAYGFILFAVLHGSRWLQRPLEWAPLRWIGFISFSLYMWHDPFVIYFFYMLLPKFQNMGWNVTAQYTVYVLWVDVTTIPLAFTLYRWVELPGMRLGEKLCKLIERTPQKIKIAPIAEPAAVEDVPAVLSGSSSTKNVV